TRRIGDCEEAGGPFAFFGEEDACFFEEFADRADAVGLRLDVTVYIAGVGGKAAVRRVEVPAGEDVRGREGGRGLSAVEEEDSVIWGNQDYGG
ncbi:MAG: hypothetical protein M1823_007178, partial [Watsoniomyces obsoletus]